MSVVHGEVDGKQVQNFFNNAGNWFSNTFGGLFYGPGSIGESLSNPSDWWDRFKNGKTNEVNKQIADQNLEFQRENLDYQKALQREIFQREDTAYQRTVDDMRLAGMNPLAMQGTNGAGEAIQTEALNNGYKHSDTGNMQAISMILDTINQISNTRNNASLQQSQANLINQQAENQRIKNNFESDLLSKTLESSELSNIGKRFENERSNIAWLNDQSNYKFNVQYGLTENMPDILKMTALMSGNKIYNRNHSSFERDWNTFGKYAESFPKSTGTEFLSSQQLKGALVENQLINGLLSLIPMGLGKLFGGK